MQYVVLLEKGLRPYDHVNGEKNENIQLLHDKNAQQTVNRGNMKQIKSTRESTQLITLLVEEWIVFFKDQGMACMYALTTSILHSVSTVWIYNILFSTHQLKMCMFLLLGYYDHFFKAWGRPMFISFGFIASSRIVWSFKYLFNLLRTNKLFLKWLYLFTFSPTLYEDLSFSTFSPHPRENEVESHHGFDLFFSNG